MRRPSVKGMTGRARVATAGAVVCLLSAAVYGAVFTFGPTGAMSNFSEFGVGRHGHTATLLTDGSVLVTGGYSNPASGFDTY